MTQWGMIWILLLAGCAGAGAGSGTAPPTTSPADRALIREARLAQNRAMAAGDIELASSYWTADVSLRRGLGQGIEGRSAYRQLLVPSGNRDSSVAYEREPTGVEVSNRWPLAFETGKWKGRLGSSSGPVVIDGRYSAQWVKRDGRWLIRSEVFVAIDCDGIGCRYAAVP